jgi:Ca2+-binding EF-hand superfamily protein
MSDAKSTSTLGLVEGRLLKLFQNDFLSLLQVFRKIDRNKTNSLNKQEFRAAIESHFLIELSEDEFEEFYRELPRDSLNKIKYLEFMTRFDTDSSSTLFDTRSAS